MKTNGPLVKLLKQYHEIDHSLYVLRQKRSMIRAAIIRAVSPLISNSRRLWSLDWRRIKSYPYHLEIDNRIYSDWNQIEIDRILKEHPELRVCFYREYIPRYEVIEKLHPDKKAIVHSARSLVKMKSPSIKVTLVEEKNEE